MTVRAGRSLRATARPTPPSRPSAVCLDEQASPIGDAPARCQSELPVNAEARV
jgi:hypothetical protein